MATRRRTNLVDKGARSESASPTKVRGPIVAGEINSRGEFFDPAGNFLQIVDDDVSPASALTAVRSGALVAYEPCGCGGGGSCQPRWLDRHDRRGLAQLDEPDLATTTDIPTYIDR